MKYKLLFNDYSSTFNAIYLLKIYIIVNFKILRVILIKNALIRFIVILKNIRLSTIYNGTDNKYYVSF